MKAVILAGGLGTRLSEETTVKPKPMVEIGGKPILWHIMKIYSTHGVHDFVICLGYKGYLIKEYFANYFLHMSDVTFDIANNEMQVHQRNASASPTTSRTKTLSVLPMAMASPTSTLPARSNSIETTASCPP
jgi:glucose-1-phosphate cytidylyltransferase